MSGKKALARDVAQLVTRRVPALAAACVLVFAASGDAESMWVSTAAVAGIASAYCCNDRPIAVPDRVATVATGLVLACTMLAISVKSFVALIFLVAIGVAMPTLPSAHRRPFG